MEDNKSELLVEELSKLSKEELINKILKLEAHNKQLKNIIAKKNSQNIVKNVYESKRPFNSSRWGKQHVLLRILYLGWAYQGYVVQEETSETVEAEIMKALMRCKLIESRRTANYHRCGRTDKGVSSFCQVISVTVRSPLDESSPSLDYCKMLNRLLPEDIRVTGWKKVTEGFSARFDCTRRLYRYYFPRGALDITLMDEGAQFLVGTHDFRNLCKMDVTNGVTRFTRTIFSARVSPLFPEGSKQSGYDMCEVAVEGIAFLWHQMRCIVSVLLLVGLRLESPTIISQLLDLATTPRKPQYMMAHWLGLCLFRCDFDQTEPWVLSQAERRDVVASLQRAWASHNTKAVLVKSMLEELEGALDEEVAEQASGLVKQQWREYKPLKLRDTCNSLEEKMNHLAKKRKIDCEEAARI